MPIGFERLAVETAPVGRITLVRPERRNALDGQMLAEIVRAARDLDGADGVRIVIISGAGTDFCSGVDLDQAAEFRAEGVSALGRFVAHGDAAVAALDGMRAVTIAAVHGHCVGAGMVLAASCDFRVASRDAVFSLPEIRLGFPVMWGGIPLLLRHLGPAAVKDLVLTSRRIGVEEARRLGFVNRVADEAESADRAAASLAADLAAMPEPALRAAKRMIDAAMQGRLGPQEEFAEAVAILRASGELPPDE